MQLMANVKVVEMIVKLVQVKINVEHVYQELMNIKENVIKNVLKEVI